MENLNQDINRPHANVEITSDPTICRVVIEDMVSKLRTGKQGREVSLAITKLEEASMWLNEALRRS